MNPRSLALAALSRQVIAADAKAGDNKMHEREAAQRRLAPLEEAIA